MDDDFNTALAIAHLYETARVLNRILHHPSNDPAVDLSLLGWGRNCFKNQGAVLGLFQFEPTTFLNEKKEKRLKTTSLGEDEITRLLQEREKARMAKDWKRADEIRDHLTTHNVLLEDGPEGTRWRIKQ
jgi:cysteinyl-tRNA synthetase